MRSSFAVLVFATVGAVSGVAHAQDAPPSEPAPGGPPPAAMPPPPPPGYMPPPPEQEERSANNAIYLELLGPALFYSIDYDRAFGDFAARIGFGYFSVGTTAVSGNGTSVSSAKASFLAVPITVSYLGVGSKKHMLELGAGVTILSLGAGFNTFGAEGSSANASAIIVAPTGIVGYRLQPPDGGFFLHAGLAPELFIGGRSFAFWPAPYVGLGGTF